MFALCFSSIRLSVRPSPLLFSPSPLLPHSLHPLHLSTPVISPFNFTYLELAADSLKYLGVHFRYALIHRWADTAFVCTRRGDEAAASEAACGKKTALIRRRRKRAVPGAHGGASGKRDFRLKTAASFEPHVVFPVLYRVRDSFPNASVWSPGCGPTLPELGPSTVQTSPR